MKIIYSGTKIMARRLMFALTGNDYELVCTNEVGEIEQLQKQNEFDLIVLDSSAKQSHMTCRYIREINSVPIVIMIGKRQADWSEMQLMDVDGYIPEGVDGAELAARLRAIIRRFRGKKDLSNDVCISALGILTNIGASYITS
ncbi:MAG: hypothetical protein PHQ86_06880 [Dehalococcoidales bacterium]|nr:hypothetical protein [Dehalococcoidales bacterium]